MAGAIHLPHPLPTGHSPARVQSARVHQRHVRRDGGLLGDQPARAVGRDDGGGGGRDDGAGGRSDGRAAPAARWFRRPRLAPAGQSPAAATETAPPP